MTFQIGSALSSSETGTKVGRKVKRKLLANKKTRGEINRNKVMAKFPDKQIEIFNKLG